MSRKDMLGPLLRALVGLPVQHHGIVLDVANKLGGANGVAVRNAIAKALREVASVPADTTHLRFLEAVALPATLGATTIAQSGDVFRGCLDQDFKARGTDVSSVDTAPATALIYEMTKDGNFYSLFSSLGEGWRSRLPTQGQIVAFCQKYPDKLRQDGYGTFFAFQVEGRSEPFVAGAMLDAGQLVVRVLRLGRDYVWFAGRRHRVVVLQ